MSESDTKLYVGGLAPETNKDALEAQFSQYGEIVDSVVMIDKVTTHSRGFGFVTFKDASSANAALGTAQIIDGREVSCKKAVRDSPKQIVQDSSGTYNTVKIFVGGLPSTCDYDKLTAYFARYGQISDAVVMMDSQTKRHRGFGYVTFTESSPVEAVMTQYSDHKIDGKWVEVKRCIPQDNMRGGGGDRRGGGSDRRGGRGRSRDRGSSRDRDRDRDAGALAALPGAYPGMGAPGPYGDPYADPYAAWYAAAARNPYGAAYGGAYPPMGYPQPGMPPPGPYGAYGYPPPGPYGDPRYGPAAAPPPGYRPGPY